MGKQRQIFRDVLNFGRKHPPPEAVAPSLVELRAQIATLNQEKADLQEQCEKVEQERASQALLIAALKADWMRLEQELERREQALEALTGEYGKLFAEKQLIGEQLEMAHAVEVRQAEIIATHKTQIEALFRTVAKLENEIATYDSDTTAAKDKHIADLVAALQAQASDIMALMERKRELEADAEHYREQITTLQEKSVTLANENNVLHALQQLRDLASIALPDDVLTFLRSLHKGDFRSDRMGPVAFNAAQSLLWKYDSTEEKEQSQ